MRQTVIPGLPQMIVHSFCSHMISQEPSHLLTRMENVQNLGYSQVISIIEEIQNTLDVMKP